MVVGSLPNRGQGHIDWEMARVAGNSTVLVTSRSRKQSFQKTQCDRMQSQSPPYIMISLITTQFLL